MEEGDTRDLGPSTGPTTCGARWPAAGSLVVAAMCVVTCGSVWWQWDQKASRDLSLSRTIAELRSVAPDKARPLIGQTMTYAGSAIHALADAQSLGGTAGSDATLALGELAKLIEKRRAR